MNFSPLIRRIILDLTWRYISDPSKVPKGREVRRTPRGATQYNTSKRKRVIPPGVITDGSKLLNLEDRIDPKQAEYNKKHLMEAIIGDMNSGIYGNKELDPNVTPEELREFLDSKIKQLVKGSEIRIRMSARRFNSIFEHGRLRPGVETGRTVCDQTDIRRDFEPNFFNFDPNMDYAHWPIYGYLMHPDIKTTDEKISIDEYGDVCVVLKPEVNNRTTFVVGDTMGESGGTYDDDAEERVTQTPCPVNNPSYLALNENCRDRFSSRAKRESAVFPVGSDDDEALKKWSDMAFPFQNYITTIQLLQDNFAKDLSDLSGGLFSGAPYFETQIWGGVTPNDIQSIRITRPNPVTKRYLNKLEKLKSICGEHNIQVIEDEYDNS